jgi:hypothetical protein
MILEKDDLDRTEVFLRLLLIGNGFNPPKPENEQLYLHEILEKYGFTLVRSECTILENTRIGDSVITIARYSIEYQNTGDDKGKTLYFEGDLAMQVDRRGNMSISISAKPGVSPLGIETFPRSDSPIGNNITPASFISPPEA